MVDAGQEGEQLAHMDRLAKRYLINTKRHNVALRITAGASIGHLVEQFQYCAAVHIAGKIRRIGGHQYSHAELMCREMHREVPKEVRAYQYIVALHHKRGTPGIH